MDPALVALIGVLLCAFLFKTIEYAFGRSPDKSKYDIDYVRAKEMEIWGYYFTLPSEKKAVEKKKDDTPGQRVDAVMATVTRNTCATAGCPQLTSATYCQRCRMAGKDRTNHWSNRYKDNPVRNFVCHRCNREMLTKHPDRDTCQNCTLAIIQERTAERDIMEAKKKWEHEKEQYKKNMAEYEKLKAEYDKTVERFEVMVDGVVVKEFAVGAVKPLQLREPEFDWVKV